MTGVLVIGNGPAAHRLVHRLRQLGHSGGVTVLGAEPRAAYNRVLLTSVLDGSLPPDAIALPRHPDGTRVRLGVTAVGVDRARRLVLARADDGRGMLSYRYDRLVLATGARPRIPEVAGVRMPGGRLAEGVRCLRTLADCERIGPGQVAVLGAGVLGVEAALALRRAGYEVTLAHRRAQPMGRLLGPHGGELLAGRLRDLGVELELGHRAVGYAPGKLLLDDGRTLPADTLLLCTGVTPETGLARAAGLAVACGVVVDDQLRTSDPYVHAIGDCAEHAGRVSGLVESAWQQADTLARVLTGERVGHRAAKPVIRPRTPGIHIAALGTPDGGGAEVVTFSDPARGRYASLALREQRITGAVLIGLPQAIASVSQLYDRDLPVPADRLALLLGTASRRGSGSLELPDDAVVCLCNNVMKRTLSDAWRGGARELPDLAAATRATTGCGGCAPDVRRLCAVLERETG
ncbi:FAD-dependent oxidoreductase [Streptomyces silvisoli]|uniref:FAD-dependent oxidoreductase n=1 Tax=Streptomyces silvisoli TaxID=3034235 RepID=A0ABT5ZT54_9ACTN|nr:FAD-dependent oxidoreductase [Streptomyces silvisoli]MDF3292208.1 FAD-dependent oxidoreductase [Streptomyces silvisoli]